MKQEIRKTIYVLELEDDCYYVGWVEDSKLEKRLGKHLNGLGAEWTREHRPKNLIKMKNGTRKEANNLTKKMIREHGFDKVRGVDFLKGIGDNPDYNRLPDRPVMTPDQATKLFN